MALPAVTQSLSTLMEYVKGADATTLAVAAAVALTLPASVATYKYATRRKSFGPKEDGPEVVIVGAGVVGSVIAHALAQDGRKVTLVERDWSEPDRIVGELLQPGGLETLENLGLADCVQGIDAVDEYGYLVYYKDRYVELEYPKNAAGEQRHGTSFHHGRFIMKLRDAAKSQSNITCLAGTVTQLISDHSGVVRGVEYKDKETGEKKEIRAPLTIVADGCFSKFRKDLVKNSASISSKFYGLVLEDAPLMKPNYAIVALVNPRPVLFYQIGTHETRVLVDFEDAAAVADAVTYMRETVAPQLPEYLQKSFLDALEKDRLRSMPNSYLPAAPLTRKGVICLGDALNMRHPLTGGGMSVAFKDIELWRGYLRSIEDLRDHDAIVKAQKDFQWQRKSTHSFVVNVMANALYSLFAANDDNLDVLREGCFKYFELGGDCVDGPISLLSIVRPNPSVLLRHFFAVAIYGTMQLYSKCQSVLEYPRAMFKSFFVMKSAVGVIAPLTWQEMKVLFSPW